MSQASIIEGCLRGSVAAEKEMVAAYGTLVLSVALNVLGNRQDAEDVSQETFLQVFRHLDRYDRERSFKPWLLTIAYRRSLDLVRKRRRFKNLEAHAKREAASALERRAPDPEIPSALPSKILETLSPRERIALCLWANEGYAAKDIAQVMSCSASTVRVYLFSARRKIKALMENDHGLLQHV